MIYIGNNDCFNVHSYDDSVNEKIQENNISSMIEGRSNNH